MKFIKMSGDNKKDKCKKAIAGLMSAVLITGIILPIKVQAADSEPYDMTQSLPPQTGEEEEAAMQKAYEMTVDSNSWKNWPEGPKTFGEAAIIMDADSGAILYSKNIDGKGYPASITKIVTTLIALENGNLDDKVTVTDDCIDCLSYGYAHIGLNSGEELTLKDALYAVLLASANEAAYAIGESIGEGYDWFINEMNSRAKELGALNSNFVNTNGLEDTNHYTSARDMALITRELLLNHPEFQEICQTLQYTIPATNLTDETRTFQQKHQMFYEGNEYYDARVIAGKTGYTDQALNTLVTCADDGNRRLICVVLRTHGRNVYTDTEALLNYGFDNFEKVSIKEKEISEDIKSVDDDAYVVLPSGVEFSDLEKEIVQDTVDKKTGKVYYTYDGHMVGSSVITLSDKYIEANSPEEVVSDEKEVKKETGIWKLILIGIAVFIAVIVVLFILLYIAALRRKKKREAMRRRKRAQRRKYEESRRYQTAQDVRKNDNRRNTGGRTRR
ncbi:MAG: D-alanyl-D-alanine carboxypeptidase family protein [Bariatricus sp.]|nr:D-alanyl-D-alanine carboxypeptidase family protein [Bariatricus sp.]